jgi:hypothetical protein
MITVLLALGLFIVLMQLGLMSLVRRLAQQLELERSRIDKLERVRLSRRADAADSGDFVSTLGGEPTRPAPVPERAAEASVARATPVAAATPENAATSVASVDPGAGAAAPFPAGPATPPATGPAQAPERVDPAELRGEMLGLMRQLVDQGLSVREIASRCGLSEAEAELMLSLNGAANA